MAIQWVFWPLIQPFVWFLFYPTIFFVAQFTTRFATLLATVESIAIAWYFFIPPQFSWRIDHPENLYSCVVFLLMGLVFSQAHERLRQMRQKLELALTNSMASEAKISDLYKQTLELDVLKTQFFANMSHEIRTPLNAILGLSYLVRKNTISPEQIERLDKISVAGNHLLSILNDILDFSKIEAGKLVIEQENFSIHGIMDQIRSMTGDDALKKGLTVRVNYEGLPGWLVGDQSRIRQALLNYMNNAIKFTAHGTIDLRARLLDSSDGHVLVRFEVEDTGIGIPQEKLAQLFKPFKQVDASTTRKYGGTGLGLAITQHLAELMGGSAGVDSNYGKGSLFWFTAKFLLGSQPAVAETDESENFIKSRYAGHRVLLAEDDEINREVASSLLTDVGLIVDQAENGAMAIAKAKANDYELILMDVQMPLLDGFSATKVLRDHPGTRNTPILAFTANIFEDYKQRCISAGMNDFVAKPVDPKMLYSVIYKWLKSKSSPAASPDSEFAYHSPRSLEDHVNEQNLLTCLEVIPGLDTKLGLANFSGKALQYFDLIKQFIDKEVSSVAKWKELLEEKRIDEVSKSVHALKGTAGSLGFSELRKLAINIESKLLLNEHDVVPLIIQLTDAIHAIKSQLDRIDVSTHPSNEMDPGMVEAALQDLIEKLECSNFSALESYKSNAVVFAAKYDEKLVSALNAAMVDVDFKQAQSIAEQMLASLKEPK